MVMSDVISDKAELEPHYFLCVPLWHKMVLFGQVLGFGGGGY